MTLEMLLAREAIRATMALYNNAGDRGAIDEMMACFTDDAVLEVNADKPVGALAIRAYYDAVRSSGLIGGADRRPTRHHLTTSRIEFDGSDSARGWTYFLLVRDGRVIQNGIYIDHFRRDGERWLLSSRRVKVEYDGLLPGAG